MVDIKYKKSKQRERILELLRNTDNHPTADWIYSRLKKDFKSLSLGTVYRNLNILIEQGNIIKIDFGSTFDRFDAVTEKHYHFVCKKCGSITDLKIEVNDYLESEVQDTTGFKVDSHRLEFFGICRRCL